MVIARRAGHQHAAVFFAARNGRWLALVPK